ncbi:MAG: hypothetical protein M1834_007157 [Cirrosporium novae-zelandiae]|nr:MAG: hypothetical protein M1834_007157 [Cirrosporium novae-zelandiae]
MVKHSEQLSLSELDNETAGAKSEERVASGDCFVSLDFRRAGRTIDFGSNGFTGSVSDWHNLLQITAPDPQCGIVFVRGNYPDNPSSVLARAQDESGRGSWGFKISDDSDILVDGFRGQGLINYRWPYMAFDLKEKPAKSPDQTDGGNQPASTGMTGSIGRLHTCSFVKDGTVFQVIRLQLDEQEAEGPPEKSKSQKQLIFTIGGVIRFGCICKNGSYAGRSSKEEALSSNGDQPEQIKEHIYTPKTNKDGYINSVSFDEDVQLDVQLFINEEKAKFDSKVDLPAPPECIDISTTHCKPFSWGEQLVVVATFSLSAVGIDTCRLLDTVPSSEDIMKYLGVANDSDEFTGKLWIDACNGDLEIGSSHSASENRETHALARCVERIMCVSSLPRLDKKPQPSPQNVELPPSNESSKRSSTIMQSSSDFKPLNPSIHHATSLKLLLEASNQFFKEEHHLKKCVLGTEVGENLEFKGISFITNIVGLNGIDLQSMLKLKFHIKQGLIWMLHLEETNELLLPTGRTSSDCGPFHCPGAPRDGIRSRPAFRTICIWYVMIYCNDVFIDREFSKLLRGNFEKVIRQFSVTRQNRPETVRSETPQARLEESLLKWYHFSCLHLICEKNPELETDNAALSDIKNSESEWALQVGIAMKALRRQQPAHRLQVDPAQLYLALDERVDRLAHLSQELKLAKRDERVADTLVKQIRRRILSRKRTTNFNHGPQEESEKLEMISPPWELSILNHHSRLSEIWNTSEDVDDLNNVKNDCFEFLLSDYSFTPSWDRSNPTMVSDLWDIYSSSVICATLLDSISKELKRPRAIAENDSPKIESDQPEAENELKTEPPRKPEQPTRELRSEDDKILLSMNDIQRLLNLGSQSHTVVTELKWMAFQPIGYAETFFPDWMLQSLDDSPEMFRQKQLEKVRLRSEMKRYFEKHETQSPSSSAESDWSIQNMHDRFNTIETSVVSVFDFSLVRRDDSNSLIHISATITRPPTSTVAPARLTSIESPKQSEEPPDQYKKELLTHLSDSAFIHIWHPRAVDVFNDYIGSRMRFDDSKETRSETWTTSITISHWKLKSEKTKLKAEQASNDERRLFDEFRENGQFPPKGLSESAAPNNEVTPQSTGDSLEERSSSVVITGDHLGVFWVCSVLSSSVNKSEDHSIQSYASQVEETLQLFVHLQAAGRRLCFVVLVGHLCADLAIEYSNIVSHLENVLGVSKRVLFDGVTLEKSHKALERLRRMLWGLESLRIFENTLSSSVAVIKNVKEDSVHAIKYVCDPKLSSTNFILICFQEREQWDRKLLEHSEKVFEEFDKRFQDLSKVLININQKIEQISRLRDGHGDDQTSSFTNVEQSLESLEQNANIRILTYITIAYLPLGFVAGLFSVSDGILPQSAGRGLFIGLIAGLMVATFVLAKVIPTISNLFQSSSDPWWRLKEKAQNKKGSPRETPNRSTPKESPKKEPLEDSRKSTTETANGIAEPNRNDSPNEASGKSYSDLFKETFKVLYLRDTLRRRNWSSKEQDPPV